MKTFIKETLKRTFLYDIVKFVSQRNKKRSNTMYKRSYSQCGEDLIVDLILTAMKVQRPTYLDIGAHHPTYLSNTYLFYSKGCVGVCIEPDPYLWEPIKKKRKRDTCLNVGVGVAPQGQADLYIMTARTLNTFSREEAERYQNYGHQRIEKIVKVPLVSVNHVIEQYFDASPNFVSLDAEGIDLDILKTFDLGKYRPQVFCIETLTYTEDNTEHKETEVIDYMTANDYFVYADTYINTIFVDKSAWISR